MTASWENCNPSGTASEKKWSFSIIKVDTRVGGAYSAVVMGGDEE
jgi:hypothetical protein